MSRHRADVRPRWGRIALLASSVTVTGVALLGGVGVISTSVATGPAAAVDRSESGDLAPVDATVPRVLSESAKPSTPAASSADDAASTPAQPVLPAGSGAGKRIVFDQSDQRVWLVDANEKVLRTYPVSGSLTDNLDPGTYSVYSKSEHAYGVDDSGTMQWFVRFTHGPTGAAIGFHDIPVDDGAKIQTVAQLGTPQSHGCIRQRRQDAIALWKFAPLDTKVVVTA